MTNDGRGYSFSLVKIVEAQDASSPVVRFAKHCIAKGVPASQVAQEFGVTRAMVYYWFKGVHKPSEKHVAAMLSKLEEAKAGA